MPGQQRCQDRFEHLPVSQRIKQMRKGLTTKHLCIVDVSDIQLASCCHQQTKLYRGVTCGPYEQERALYINKTVFTGLSGVLNVQSTDQRGAASLVNFCFV